MSLTRRHGYVLLAIAAWNVFIWLNFARNLYAAHADGEQRATGYWVAHTVLIVVGLVIAVVLTRMGLRVVRGSREPNRLSVHQKERTPT